MMKQLPLITMLLLALCAGRVHGQGSSVGTTAFSVEVVSGLAVTAAQDLEFGNVVAGQGVVTRTNNDANIGKFQIVGRQNRWVSVTLNAPAALTNGANSIPYTPAAGYNDSADDPTNLSGTFGFLGTASWQLFRLADSTPPGNLGQAFVYIYGSINVGAVPVGTYTGTFTLTAAYF